MGFYSDLMGFYSDLMGFYSDLMGFYSDLMGFYSDSMRYQWEFQDPKMEVLYHIRPYFVGIFPYIALT